MPGLVPGIHGNDG